ncbi:MAG: hypothetical protein NC312_12745 [Bacteroides fragilis]|nr:hypothetical protein [Bacteroides fragilis]
MAKLVHFQEKIAKTECHGNGTIEENRNRQFESEPGICHERSRESEIPGEMSPQ